MCLLEVLVGVGRRDDRDSFEFGEFFVGMVRLLCKFYG